MKRMVSKQDKIREGLLYQISTEDLLLFLSIISPAYDESCDQKYDTRSCKDSSQP